MAWPAYVDPFTYTPVGTATFHDGFVRSGFGFNPADYPMEVALERSNEKPTQFRLVNPYPKGYLDVNEGTDEDGYIVFDIGTPECVIVYPEYRSGFYEESVWGFGNFYFFNLEGLIQYDYAMQGIEVSAIDVMNMMLREGYIISDIIDNVVTIRNGLFGYDANPAAGGQWKIEGQNVEMTSTIFMPEGSILGVEDIVVDNAPAEYYNLQGIRVENPENGIYIRRQGSTATKIYVK